MSTQNEVTINSLQKRLPEGLVVDAAWLQKHGYSTSLRSQYVSSGKLERPAREVYMRPVKDLPYRGPLRWQQVVISLQTILGHPLIVGGQTAIALHGYAHYLPQARDDVHLYGPTRPPNWLFKLRINTTFKYHNSRQLFANTPPTKGIGSQTWDMAENDSLATDPKNFATQQSWGQWSWPLTLSMPERAILELLDELPKHESFHNADKIMEGLHNLRPRLLQKLLEDCRSIKVKRLFCFFAERHNHTWFKRLDISKVDLGKGKRALAKNGRLDPKYNITIPADMDALY